MKRKAIIITLGILLLVAAVLILTIFISRPAVAKIAVVPLTGAITSGNSALSFGSTITPELVRDHLTRAERDTALQAIVLCIESPGGEIALLELVDTIPARVLGLSARNLILPEILSRSCPQPLFLYQS